VLVVDDHPDLRTYLRKHLAPHYQVLEPGRGDTALEALRAELPDVVISDVMMPGMDGHALLRAIRSDPETDFIPVILLTAKAGSKPSLEGPESGADDYVNKPFDAAQWLARVRNLLRARERVKAR
jgi:DNA-binding response OmpR family regulator